MTQRTLGIFIGSFTYVLLCLFFLDKQSTFFFIPVLAILFTMLTMATFIIFVNHIVNWLQVTNMTEDMKEESAIVAKNLLVKEMDAYRVKNSASIEHQVPENREQACSIYVEESGYIQTIDFINLIKEAEKDDLIIELHYKVGNYAFVSTPLLSYWPNGANSIDESKYYSMIRIGKNQNEVQDIEFSLSKLVEVAIRAIGSNDPKTATRTIYQIGDLLIKISQLSFFTPYLADEEGNLRIILDNLEFKDYLYIGLSSIRHYARKNVILTVEILKVLHAIAKVRKKHDCTPVWDFAVYTTRSLEINYIHSLDREKLYNTLLDMAKTTGHEMEYNKLVRKMMRTITDEDDRKEIERKIPLGCY
ncbi:putative membrane protein [Thalassobacillus pellis]|nr:putative membrane protein [Thalassobacillus pellis]